MMFTVDAAVLAFVLLADRIVRLFVPARRTADEWPYHLRGARFYVLGTYFAGNKKRAAVVADAVRHDPSDGFIERGQRASIRTP